MKTERTDPAARFTVEAALLMGIILPVLIGVLMAAFYLHDRVYLQGICRETASSYINVKSEEDGYQTAEKLMRKRMSAGPVWAGEVSGQLLPEEGKAECTCKAVFRLAGMSFPGSEYLNTLIGEKAEQQFYDPADLIRKVRGAKYLIDEALDDYGDG